MNDFQGGLRYLSGRHGRAAHWRDPQLILAADGLEDSNSECGDAVLIRPCEVPAKLGFWRLRGAALPAGQRSISSRLRRRATVSHGILRISAQEIIFLEFF